MSRRACQVLCYDQHTGCWRPCGRPDTTDGAGSHGRAVCLPHRRELARLQVAGLAGQVRYATDPATADTDAHTGTAHANSDAQTTLPIPEPTPRPYPWQHPTNTHGEGVR